MDEYNGITNATPVTSSSARLKAWLQRTSWVKPLSVENSFRISCYPQPSSNANILNIESQSSCPAEVQLLDLVGNKLKTVYKGDLNKGVNIINSDISTISAGMYFYRFKANGKEASIKFIKQ
jgi:hypothetical protein